MSPDNPNNNETFESVNKQIESADLDALEQELTGGVGTADTMGQVCKAYGVVKPILSLIASLPLIPNKWKQAIKIFMTFMDGLCGS